jgi:hypothetical protein
VTSVQKRIEPQKSFSGASVDPTDARNDILGCFGRSHRSGLVPRDDITPDERGVMVRKAGRFAAHRHGEPAQNLLGSSRHPTVTKNLPEELGPTAPLPA